MIMRGSLAVFLIIFSSLMLMSANAFLPLLGNRRGRFAAGINMKSNNNSYRRMLKKAKDGRPK